MPGPLPKETRRRRNGPTIAGVRLPAAGRPGRVPKPPEWSTLGESGLAWWRWAWKTPQACAWGSGFEPLVARRAGLEDDMRAAGEVEGLDFAELMDADRYADFKATISRLAGIVSNRLGIMREMRELDDRLGLSPRGMASLRWTIEDDAEPALKVAPVAEISDYQAALQSG